MKTVTKRHARSISLTVDDLVLNQIRKSKFENVQSLPLSKHFKGFQRKICRPPLPLLAERSPTQSNRIQPNPTKSNQIQPNPTKSNQIQPPPPPGRITFRVPIWHLGIQLWHSILLLCRSCAFSSMATVCYTTGRNWLRASRAIPQRRGMNLFTSLPSIGMPSAPQSLSFLMVPARQQARLLLHPHRNSRFYTRNPAKPPTK